ncbi:MAG: hypothetical protein ACR2LE_03440, partial [Nocardioidaceae bacterium]
MPLHPTILSWVAVAALVLAVAAVLLAGLAFRRAGRRPVPRTASRSMARNAKPSDRVPSTGEVAAELEALRTVAQSALRNLAAVRYEASGDIDGHLSWSMAL